MSSRLGSQHLALFWISPPGHSDGPLWGQDDLMYIENGLQVTSLREGLERWP